MRAFYNVLKYQESRAEKPNLVGQKQAKIGKKRIHCTGKQIANIGDNVYENMYLNSEGRGKEEEYRKRV